MSLAERATTPPQSNSQGMPCSIAELLKTLPPKEAAALRVMLDAPWRVWPHTVLEKAILDEGHYVGTGVVGKHRRGDCRCPKAKP